MADTHLTSFKNQNLTTAQSWLFRPSSQAWRAAGGQASRGLQPLHQLGTNLEGAQARLMIDDGAVEHQLVRSGL